MHECHTFLARQTLRFPSAVPLQTDHTMYSVFLSYIYSYTHTCLKHGSSPFRKQIWKYCCTTSLVALFDERHSFSFAAGFVAPTYHPQEDLRKAESRHGEAMAELKRLHKEELEDTRRRISDSNTLEALAGQVTNWTMKYLTPNLIVAISCLHHAGLSWLPLQPTFAI